MTSPFGEGRRAVARGGGALIDQAVSSATNLGLSIVVARSVGIEEFGAFSLAFTLYVLGLGLARAVASEPLAVRFSTAARADLDRASEAATGVAVAVGIAVGVPSALVGLAVGGPLRDTLVPLGVGLAGLLLQDTLRFVAFTGGAPRRALVNDLSWAALSVAAFCLLLGTDNATVGGFTLVFGFSATTAAAIDLRRHRITPHLGAAPAWLRRHRDLVPSFAGDFLIRNASRHVVVVILTLAAGLGATAAVRAAQLVFGPMNVLLLGISAVAVPELARTRHDHGERQFRLAVGGLSLGLTLVAVAVGACALAVPDTVGKALLGDTWLDARDVIIPQAALMASMGAVSGYAAGLRVLAAAKAGVAVRLLTLPVTLAAGLAGIALAGSAGAVSGMALANWLAVLAWRRQWRRHSGGLRPQASATVAGSVTTVPPPIASRTATKSAKQ